MRPIIVGAGPAGLTLAWLLRDQKPIILEKETQIGGCHSVRRGPNGEFSEHGPRVYSSTYVTTKKLLNTMGVEFEDLFVPYKFSPGSIGSKTLLSLSFSELFQLAIAYFWSSITPAYYKSMSMKDFSSNFSESTIDYFDRLCRLTDGAGLETYNVYKFLQLVNQNVGYQFYQPRKPNDVGLFKVWGDALKKAGVEIITGAEVLKCIVRDNKCTGVEARIGQTVSTFTSDLVILALPPRQLSKICSDGVFTPKSGRPLSEWSQDNSYIDYITITYSWNRMLDMKSKWGFPSTKWGIASVVLSDYFEDVRGTLISAGITNVDAGARGLPDNELIEKTFHQLKEVYPELPQYDSAIIGSRLGQETAYIQSSKDPSTLPQSGTIVGLYNVGTQNGKSKYAFTSMETAVVNAVELAQTLGGENLGVAYQWTLNERIMLIFIIVLMIVIIYYIGVKLNFDS